MKKIQVSLILMFLVFGVSSVLAQDSPTEEIVAVSGGGGSAAGQLVTAVSSSTSASGGTGKSITTVSQSTTTTQKICIVNTGLMRELDRLMIMLKQAEESNDEQSVKELLEKIHIIKEEIRKDTKECERPTLRVEPTEAIEMSPTKVIAVNVRPTYFDKCAELDDWEAKKKHYEELYALSDKELGEKGYSEGKEEIKKILIKLEKGIEEIKAKCEVSTRRAVVSDVQVLPSSAGGGGQGGGCYDTDGGKNLYVKGIAAAIWDSCLSNTRILERWCTEMNTGADYSVDCPPEYICNDGACVASSSGGGGGGVAVPEEETTEKIAVSIAKPVAVLSGREVTDYYKLKISNIMVKEISTEQQVKKLKELRNEIDKLIEELIKSKDEISTEEVSELITEIRVKPKEIRADNVVISTINKKIAIKVNKKDLKIIPTETQVVIQDGNLEIKAQELSIRNGVLKVGNSEVELTASDIVKKIKVEPKEIELKEENAKAVYKIKVDEDRKLMGFIPVKAEKDLTVDTTSQNAEIVKEEYPWWVFMTTKSK